MHRAAVAAIVVCFGVFAQAAGAITFSAAVPSGRGLSQLAASDSANIALEADERAERLVRESGGTLLSATLRIWKLDGLAAARLVPELDRLGALRYAEPARSRTSLVRFTDPLATPEIGYHLRAIGADRAEAPGPGFPITVIDSGLDLTHPDFAGRPNTVLLNPQFVSGPEGGDYHGTEVAATAAAAVNGVGGEGAYPEARLRIFDLRDDLADASVVAGIEAALAAGPSVINLSLGGPDPSRAEYEATQLAFGSGSLVVASSGNELEDGNPILYPASFPHVLTVGATGRNDQATVFSSSSAAVDLSAPGEEIPFQDPLDPSAYDLIDGTSFSAPLVSAAAAWVRTVRGPMTIGQLGDLLRFGARDIGKEGYDESTGFGVLDIPGSLAEPLPPRDPQEPNDDVRQVVAGGLFRAAKPLASATFNAVVDEIEDPRDVYRVSLPKGRKLTVKVTSNDDVRLALFGPTARTVVGIRSRLAAVDRAGKAPETLTYANKGRGALVLFLEVAPGKARKVANPRYRVELKTALVPR
ncbi:MAG TPA: S8 family serine peptidase [Gaiellaceae bacterium]|nr:S8 family serine peptidase [Gaiellaceae bacterium]